MKRRNLYQEVTNKIIMALESGNFSEWIQPWNNGLPFNAISGHRYKGINQIILGLEMWVKGYEDPRWLTFNQAKKIGGHIKKGEKSSTVVFWKFIEVVDCECGEQSSRMSEDELPTKVVPIARAYRVFNVAQCEGIKLKPLQKNYFDVDAFTKSLLTLPEIRWGGMRACYIPSKDVICLPKKENFIHAEGFKETFYHELIHWTGHENRLNRNLKNRFGSAEYAMEELVAELGSAFLMANTGVPFGETQYTDYIDSWLEVLHKDSRAIFTAARKAQDACDFVLEKAGLQECGEEFKKAA